MDASPTRRAGTALACLLALAVLPACQAAVPHTAPGRGQQARAPHAPGDLEKGYIRVVRDVLPSVVQVQAAGDLGSGIVYDDQGHIVTNAHVVGDEQRFRVTTAQAGAPLTARLVSSFPEQDLAVIKLERMPEGLRPAKFGDSSEVQVGQIVLAMGSPLGLSSSVTQGIVSATGRTVSETPDGGGTGATIPNMIQTSAAINPGNSGGALVDLDGEVIGIPTLAASDPSLGGDAAAGIGFAIPASMVRTVADQIIEQGRVTHTGRAALGIVGRTVVDGNNRATGVAIVEVTRDGAAADAGLRAGDVITRLGSRQITTITSLTETLATMQPGDEVTVAYRRDGDDRTARVTLGEH
ncbi:S1C family serine protease [Streptomyces fragilis]|uniref:Trypsin-like peptidase domain-containing protein n=1 Tax=Streptomyces fragilis TaxID=67301 RepID=A0ABV2YBU2_9ACTN|nr:trypsin-like peptidase domain-containing protein [Streptomyces fragilis]